VKRDNYHAKSEILAVVLPKGHNFWDDSVTGITVPDILKVGSFFKTL